MTNMETVIDNLCTIIKHVSLLLITMHFFSKVILSCIDKKKSLYLESKRNTHQLAMFEHSCKKEIDLLQLKNAHEINLLKEKE